MANINIKRVAEELYALYGSEGLEFFLYADGETGSRQVGSVGRHENKIILTRNVNRNAGTIF